MVASLSFDLKTTLFTHLFDYFVIYSIVHLLKCFSVVLFICWSVFFPCELLLGDHRYVMHVSSLSTTINMILIFTNLTLHSFVVLCVLLICCLCWCFVTKLHQLPILFPWDITYKHFLSILISLFITIDHGWNISNNVHYKVIPIVDDIFDSPLWALFGIV